MSNTAWIVIGLIFVALAASIGIYLYQKAKSDNEKLNNEKLAILTGSLGSTVQLGQTKAGLGGFINDFLGSSSGSSIVSSLLTKK